MNWQKLFNTKKIPKKKRQKISQICLEQLEINVVQKSVKNLRLTVNAPKGEVRVSAPLRVSKEFIELFLGSKIDWIKEQQEKIRQQTLSSEKTYVAEEKHELLGKTYCLKLKDTASRTKVVLAGEDLLLFTRSDTPRLRKEKAMESFYKKELERIIPIYISKWEPLMKVRVSSFSVRKMRSRWGTCNTRTGKIWLSLELAKKPLNCLEYVVVHEMTHLLEPSHNKRFHALMDNFLPDWKAHQEDLR